MSLKVNVVYKGIIYRVKGIKVLCSVVMAVIFLLVAIVAMGVWMLVNVYDERGIFSAANSTSTTNSALNASYPHDVAPSIDFDKSKDTVSSDILLHSLMDKDLKGREHHESQNEQNNAESSLSDPAMKEVSNNFTVEGNSPLTEGEQFADKDSVTRIPFVESNLRKTYTSKTPLPHFTLKDINKMSFVKNSEPEMDILNSGFRPITPPVMKRTKTQGLADSFVPKAISMDIVSKTHLKQNHPQHGTNHAVNQFLQRSGMAARDKLNYVGPPVVGYGSNPYEKMTQERIKEYDSFWRTYVGLKKQNKTRNHTYESFVKFKSEDAVRKGLRPHLRGLRPSGEEYDLHIRPDAQTPLKVTPQSRGEQVTPISDPPVTEQYRPLPPRRVNRPGVTLLGPLQDLYDYSKKLAASLLSFNSKSEDQIRNSSDKLAEYGINLIESHNQVFGDTSKTPFDRIVALVPTAERLRSLDPFELSLVTWTFLDFWEFLIEKVGTLSDDDLNLLQERLERLRKRKDDTMTRVLVNETLTRYGPEKKRSISEEQGTSGFDRIQAISQEAKEKEERNETSPQTASTFSSLDPSMQQHILGSLFPSLSEKNLTKKSNHSVQSHSGIKKASSEEEQKIINATLSRILTLLQSPNRQRFSLNQNNTEMTVEGRAAWDPLGLFTSEARMQFMQFAVKVLFNFGKVYLKKPYALDCSMLLFCKDLNQDTKRGGMESMAAKLKSVGLKVLTESDQELRQSDTFGEIWRSVTSWSPLQCDAMFPRCDGPKALEIVNEVALGEN